MRPKALKLGDEVVCDGRRMTFLRRERPVGRGALSVFQCPDYVGLAGPDDKGICTMSDYQVVKRVSRGGI